MTFETKKNFIINVAFVVVVYAVLYFIFKYVIHWLTPFIIGFLITYALRPVTRLVTRLTRIKGKGIAIFVVAAFYAIVALVIWLLFTFLWTQTYDFLKILPNIYFSKIEPILFGLNDLATNKAGTISPEFSKTISEVLTSAIQTASTAMKTVSLYIIEFATGLISNFPLYLITVIFTIVLSIFISVEYDNITDFFKKQLSAEFLKNFREARKFLSGTLGKMLKAYMIIMSITFIELLTGLSILKANHVLPIAAIVAVLDILPILGTGGVLIPWAIVELILKDYNKGLGLLALYVIITVVRNLMEPRIVGHEIGLHPIITITAMYAGLRLFGFFGFITAPIVAILVKYLNDSGKIHLYK